MKKNCWITRSSGKLSKRKKKQHWKTFVPDGWIFCFSWELCRKMLSVFRCSRREHQSADKSEYILTSFDFISWLIAAIFLRAVHLATTIGDINRIKEDETKFKDPRLIQIDSVGPWLDVLLSKQTTTTGETTRWMNYSTINARLSCCVQPHCANCRIMHVSLALTRSTRFSS